MKAFEILLQSINDDNLWDNHIVLKRNEFLKIAGSTDTNLYYIVNGSLRIYIIDHDEEHILRFGYQNDLVSSLDSFISESSSNSYFQAIKKTILKSITKKSLLNLVNSTKELQKNWNKVLEQIIYEQLEREIDILTSSPEERYNRVMKRSPHLFQQIPHKHIASYLRMAPETLSRIKKR